MDSKHLRAFVRGMAALWPTQPPEYLHPTGGGFIHDAKALSGDFKAIGSDLRKSLQKNEQTSSDQREVA